ncbi:MAG: class I SAM-dependent methyltransferase [Prosthecobacter sp.]|uniref:class I SAM-dependent methyltransferase n=1 Tax=Prosthecobacter sp. TaxID=1965333 RepID=UPI003902A95A
MQKNNTENAADVLKDYDEWHRQRKRAGEPESPLAHPWYEAVFREMQHYPGGSVLEVGCGRGGFALWLSKQKPEFNITALDFSDSAIAIAKELAAEQQSAVQFVVGDAEALPFADHSFDLVVSCECMEHVPHPPQMAQELARVLKPGGKFCLTTPSYLNGMLLAWMQSWLSKKPFNSGAGVQPRENFYFFWNIRGYLRQAGLRIERMESCNYQWLLLPRVAPAKLCTMHFQSRWARWLARPFGLHFSYFGHKPDA